ncbi:uncharacterized protein LOC131331913 [Rhododendron vialii]|uniref:uncharacterized protein LOC131331913 n=1 Tax=Rhododendron vialii TaxID=182163 RepID=UPI00265DF4FD|nr:uncharacterized protein LOC131331913 [Rhododendron vialii]
MGGSSKRSNGPVLSFRRSNSRSDALGSSSPSDTSSFYAFSTGPNFYSSPPSPNTSSFYASSTSSNFCSSPTSNAFFNRSSSPTRVNLHGFVPLAPSPSVRFSIDRSRSPSSSMAVSPRDQVVNKQNGNPLKNLPKRTCMCSPTTHPGSFRCSLHKNSTNSQSVSYLPNRLHARRSAMANSLVRIGTVEGDWTKRALAQLIRPSSHQQRRRNNFQPRPSRLSIMSKTDDL